MMWIEKLENEQKKVAAISFCWLLKLGLLLKAKNLGSHSSALKIKVTLIHHRKKRGD